MGYFQGQSEAIWLALHVAGAATSGRRCVLVPSRELVSGVAPNFLRPQTSAGQ